jgi:hypothetical protein
MEDKMQVRILLCFFMLFSAVPLFALVEPAALCGIESVLPSGFADSQRNPALLPLNVRSSAGAAVIWSPFQKISTSYHSKANSGSDYGSTGSEDASAIYDGSAGLLLKFTRSAIGFAAGSADGGIYSSFTGNSTMSGTINSYDSGTGTSSSQTLTQKIHQTRTTTAPALSLAWGYSSSDNFSWGLSFTGGMTSTTIDSFTSGAGSYTSGGSTSPFSDSLKEKTAATGYTGRFKIGCAYRDENFEAGLLLTMSDLIMNSTDYSYQFDDETTTMTGITIVSGKKKSSNSLSMAGPPRITLGFRYTMKYADLVGESSVLPSGSRTVKSVAFDWGSGTAKTSTKDMQTGLAASAKAGVVLHPAAWVSLVAGCGFSVEGTKEYGTSDNSNSDAFIQMIMASAGAEFTIGRTTFGAAALYGDVLARGRYWSSGSGITSRYEGSTIRISGGASILF